jgi:hypothetical protein
MPGAWTAAAQYLMQNIAEEVNRARIEPFSGDLCEEKTKEQDAANQESKPYLLGYLPAAQQQGSSHHYYEPCERLGY